MRKFNLVSILAIALTVPALSTPAMAEDTDRETVQITISTYGVNFENPREVKALFGRIQHAAREACDSDADRFMEIRNEDRQCARRAVEQAVRSLNEPHLLAMIDDLQGHQGHNVLAVAASR